MRTRTDRSLTVEQGLRLRLRQANRTNKSIAAIGERWRKAFITLADAFYGHTGYRVDLEAVERWESHD